MSLPTAALLPAALLSFGGLGGGAGWCVVVMTVLSSPRSRQKMRCGFYGRGRTNTASGVCSIAVIVTGEGSHAHARLRATCKSEQLLYLTFARAIPEIRLAGEELAQRGVTVLVAERLNDLEIEGTVEWERPAKVREECEARLIARLTRSDEVVVIREAPSCAPLPGG